MTPKKALSPSGQLWFKQGGQNVLGESRMALLEALDKTGSITRAAQEAGISYKTAWDTLDILNNLSDQPLIESTTGGKKGGGSRLTAHGRDLLKVYRVMQKEHDKYLDRLRLGFRDFDRFFKLTRHMSLKISARNQLVGTVAAIKKSPLVAGVTLKLKGEDRIVSHITVGGLENLGLRKGEDAYALIKANWITLAAPGTADKRGHENRLRGKIESLSKSGKNAEAVIRLPGGNSLVATLTPEKARETGLKEGMEAVCLFKASNVILGVAY